MGLDGLPGEQGPMGPPGPRGDKGDPGTSDPTANAYARNASGLIVSLSLLGAFPFTFPGDRLISTGISITDIPGIPLFSPPYTLFNIMSAARYLITYDVRTSIALVPGSGVRVRKTSDNTIIPGSEDSVITPVDEGTVTKFGRTFIAVLSGDEGLVIEAFAPQLTLFSLLGSDNGPSISIVRISTIAP